MHLWDSKTRMINIHLNVKRTIVKTILHVGLLNYNSRTFHTAYGNHLSGFCLLCSIICWAQASGHMFLFLMLCLMKDFILCQTLGLALQCSPWIPLSHSAARFGWWVPCIGNLFLAECSIESLSSSCFTCTIAKSVQVSRCCFCLLKETLNILLQWIAQYPDPKSLTCEHTDGYRSKRMFYFQIEKEKKFQFIG